MWDNSHFITWIENGIDEMKTQKYSPWLALPFVTLLWAGAANAVSVNPIKGIAVDGIGLTNEITDFVPDNGKIDYYIPLRNKKKVNGEWVHDNEYGTSNNNGVYGVTDVFKCGGYPYSAGKAGLCQDKGKGSRYDAADALQMNIYFDLTGVADSVDATLDFVFDDLDLSDVNDPYHFFESMSLSYWNETGDGSSLTSIGSVYKTTAELEAQGSVTTGGKNDPIEWSIDLGTGGLDLLSLLDNDDDGFWIQLGFGSEYKYKGWNTPEQLTAYLNVSPVPLPSAVWLFGSALIGFIGMSRRTRV